MTKYQQFFYNLNLTLEGLNPTEVKAGIGDSINNNRVLTVGQVVRYLSNVRGGTKLANSLDNVYSLLRDDIVESRINNRTDAVDINEFVNFYENIVIGAGEYRGEIGKNISL